MARACGVNADAVVMQDAGGTLRRTACFQASADLIKFEVD